jgi:hypothetical protein
LATNKYLGTIYILAHRQIFSTQEKMGLCLYKYFSNISVIRDKNKNEKILKVKNIIFLFLGTKKSYKA